MCVFVVLVHMSLCLVIRICVYYVLCIYECSCLNLVGTYVLVHAGCYGIVRVLVGIYISVFGWYKWSYVRSVCRFYIWTHLLRELASWHMLVHAGCEEMVSG